MGINPVLQTGLLNQSSAQVIDGSLNFEGGKNQALKRTPTSVGNRKIWTWSCWLKKQNNNRSTFFSAGTTSSDTGFSEIAIGTQKRLRFSGWNTNWKTSSERHRDYDSFYHFVIAVDYTNSTASNKVRLYKNGVEITALNNNNTPSDTDRAINDTVIHYIGGIDGGGGENLSFTDYQMSQVYFIDGQQLGPENFGFTDPLTNTWRPKKYTGDYNVGTSPYSGIFAPYSTTARFNSFKTYTNVNENATSYTLPMGNPSHYGGKALDLASGGFQVQTNNSAAGDFFMAIWVNLDAYETSKQMGVDIAGNYVYFETVSSGAVKIRHNGSGGNTSNSGYANDTNQWQHWALSRSGGSLRAFVDGEQIVTDTGGISGDNTVLANSKFNFFGADNNTTSYNINGQVIDAVIYIGQGVSGNFTPPTAPLIDSSGNINHYSGFSDSQLYFASPLVDVSGSDPNNISDYYTTGANSFYLPMDGNSPIGQDKSGNGNNWTPVNFGGSVALDNPIVSGALPILNTTQGGTQATVGVRTDANASNLFLALPLVGNTNDESNKINSGSTTKIATNNSVTASSAQSNFYSGSHHWSANSDTLQYAEQGDELVFGTGDYTIECWLYDDNGHNGTNNRCYIFDNRIGGSVVGDPPTMTGYIDSHNEFNFGDGTNTITHTVPSTVGKWWHYAVTREGTTTRMFIDGILRGSATSSTNFTNNGIGVGRATDANYGFAGYIQDFRVYKGVAKYTSNFVVPSTSPDILPDTPSGVSGSSKLTKITDGAVSFDGTNDSLSVEDHADFTFGSGDFTMEAFVYNRSSGYRSIVMKYGGSPASSSWFWSMYNGQNQFYYYSGSNEPSVTSGKTHYNKWVHCAVSREGNTIRIFDDGELTGTLDVSSYATMNDSTVPLDIGADYADNYDMDGFISNVRIVKGTALYTSNFTPPSAPLTNVTNTKLLCCQSNTQAGSAAVTPAVPGSGLNNGTIWSTYLTTTQGANPRDFYTGNNYPASNLFDGDTSTIVYGGWIDDSDDASDLIFSPPSGITVSSKLEVYVGYYSLIKVNGSNYNTGGHNTAQAWVTVSDGSNFTGTLNELILENTTNANVVRAAAIRIDDSTILLDPVAVRGNAAATNFTPFNTDINTVRGQETGYPTLNSLDMRASTVLSNGNLTVTGAGAAWYLARSTQFISTGKYYWEYKWYGGAVTGSSGYQMGLKTPTSTLTAAAEQAGSYAFQYTSIYLTAGSNNTVSVSPGSITPGDCVMFAYDADAGLMWFGVNGKWNSGVNPATGSNSDWTSLPTTGLAPFAGVYNTTIKIDVNFGQKPFKYAPPDGFQPINAANVRPETVIARPDQYFNTTLWSGNNADPRQIDLGMAPDLIWVKTLNQTNWHWLSDSLRGTADKRYKLYSNDDTAQDTAPIYGQADSFNDFGFVAGGGTDGSNPLSDSNQSGTNYVCWSWKAGGSKGTFNVDDAGYANASDVNMNVGALNSASYNTSAIWSGMMSGPSNSGVYTNLFDGTDGNAAGYEQPSDSNTLTFTPTGGITASSSIEIYVYQSSGTYAGSADITVNGTSIKTGAVQSALGTGAAGGYVNTGTKSLTTLTWSNPSGSNNDYRLMAIRVDGKILVDSNQTPPNVPSIAPTGCSVGTKQGFSIIRYQANSTAGATIPHGLSQAPTFVLVKSLETAGSANSDWTVFHSTMGGTKAMYLNEQNGSGSTGSWNDTNPNANVITLGTAHVSNLSPNHYIAYAWHDVPGLQKFGSYGGADAFVELGFRPAVLIIKSETGSRNWIIIDSERDTFNPSDRALLVNDNAAEDDNSVYSIDFLSNGFKIRGSNGQIDGDSSYIYAAWAEAPTFNLYGGQSNAR